MAQISKIRLRDVEEAKRFDAEYFKPEYLGIINKLSIINHDILCRLSSNKYSNYNPKTSKTSIFNYIEISKINLTTGEYDDQLINKEEQPSRAKKICKKFDLLISTVRPNRNAVAIIIEDMTNLVASTGFCKLTNIKINPYYLFILFKTNDYIKLLVRKTTATQYPAVNEDDIMNLPIPILPESFQQKIEDIVKTAHSKQERSKELYKEAEQILLEELDIVNFKPKHQLTFTTSKKQIEEDRRFDAEYFQPKYEEIIKKIESYHGGWGYVRDVLSWKKGVEVGSESYVDKGYDFIRVSDFGIYGVNDSSKKVSELTYEQYKKQYQPHVGDILFTKDGTIGLSYVVKEEIKGIISGAFLRLKIKESKFLPECLCLVINSMIVKKQIDRISGGAIIAHLKPSDFETIKLPLIAKSIQEQIASKIEESHRLRKESKALLEQAKKMVEDEIENEVAKNV